MAKIEAWVTRLSLGAAAVGVGLLFSAWPSAGEADGLDALALRAVSEERAAADRAIEALRARGPAGHAALMRVQASGIEALRRGARSPEGERLRRAVDRVSGQRDGHASGLYWHTDLDAARAEARRTGRPILSLRLLGRLDEEMSCANSRYFRIVLYADPALAGRLRSGWVLHWATERPAPRITIDMGDGRRIERTITGNSVHYVLDAEGRPVDAIVGLYDPRAFAAALEGARALVPHAGDPDALARAHAARRAAEEQAFEALRARAGDATELPTFAEARASLPTATPSADVAPSATVAMPLTLSKMIVETPMLGALRRVAPRPPPPEPDWLRIGVLQRGADPLSARARGLLRLKTGRADVDAMARRLAESAIADGARNELLFRWEVHRWFEARRPETRDLADLNRAVYAELLRTPASDPWLGLRADDLYDGVEIVERVEE